MAKELARDPSVVGRRKISSGFTLVELLVVIGIIAVLIAMLMPALAKARAAALTIKCQSNLHEIGQSIYMFAQSHNGRVPDGQCGGWGNPWWPNWMYSRDFFVLEDQYGANRMIWGCPANPPDINNGTGNVLYGVPTTGGASFGAEATSRADAYAVAPGPITGPDPDNPSDFSAYGTNPGGSGGAYQYYVQLISYSYMGGNAQASPASYSPWWVMKLSDKTTTGNLLNDENPPLMCDYTLQQEGNTWQKPFNHGTSWQYTTSAAGVLTSAQAHDVRVNVLHVDGSVENKPIDLQPYWNSGTSVGNGYWAYR